MGPGAVLVLFVVGWIVGWIHVFCRDTPMPAHADPRTLAALTFDRLTRIDGQGTASMMTDADGPVAVPAASDAGPLAAEPA